MKREELMLNDIVFDYTNSPVKVCAVGQDIVVKNSFRIGSLEPNELSPIPLTEEILVKNGFNKDERSKYYHDYILELELWDFNISWSSVNGFRYEDIKLNYVHQLQHLLRLCGIEKNIEL